MVKNGLITTQALADALDISVETVGNYTLTDRIPFVILEGQYHYNLKAVVTALTAIREKAVGYIPRTREYTYQDYLELPEEPGFRYEVLAGELVKEPGPIVMHQRVSRELEFMLLAYFRQVDPAGEVFDAPLDLTLGDFTVVQPDILYISGEQRDIIKEARIDGAPLLAVEIISESSRQKDRLRKRQIYQEAGIQHYWLVDPYEKTMECLALRDGEYVLAASGINDATLTHPSFPGLSIPLAGIQTACTLTQGVGNFSVGILSTPGNYAPWAPRRRSVTLQIRPCILQQLEYNISQKGADQYAEH